MRDDIAIDWAVGIRGAIESVVRASFPDDIRRWPLLQNFDFESYAVGDSHIIVVLRDKLSGIPSGFDPKLFPDRDHPALPVTLRNVDEWQSYLMNKCSLQPVDAAMILPIHDSGKSNAAEDFGLFSPDEKAIWRAQLQTTIARQKSTIPTVSSTPAAPANINMYGPNARVNIGSTDSSINIVGGDLPEVFEQLLAAIRTTNANAEEISELEDAVAAMGQGFGTQTFLEKYRAFMSVLADHIQVFGPIVAPYLSRLAALVS